MTVNCRVCGEPIIFLNSNQKVINYGQTQTIAIHRRQDAKMISKEIWNMARYRYAEPSAKTVSYLRRDLEHFCRLSLTDPELADKERIYGVFIDPKERQNGVSNA